ncbi:hypothetical protein EJB05_51752 [Eragrostis curvula]|uniref:Uncharacterized protein n=1 Tax=Eragrostis curvula TaxID=38414 RepID=A0A5J9SUQ6_9POAL|nr:hypothetical protein EJB05_51752 [Eragrostis curvula]
MPRTKSGAARTTERLGLVRPAHRSERSPNPPPPPASTEDSGGILVIYEERPRVYINMSNISQSLDR